MIELKQINKTYNRNKTTACHALKDVSVSFEEGEFTAIIGKSGAGKSTLLHILGGIDSPDSGDYLFCGENVRALKPKELAVFRNKRVGIVLQDFALLEEYSVLENVMVPLRLGSRKHREYRPLAEQALKEVGMLEYAGKPVSELSGGQKQRTAIARAIVNSPELILADEPTGALDSETTGQIMEVLKALHEAGRTVLIITHDPLVAEAASRRLTLSDGCVVQDSASVESGQKP